jgi:hypothetical protein
MAATIIKWIIVAMSLLNAGYMTFDGTKALVTGDYIRPKTGEYAGQLGPWTRVATAVGIDPMSTLMKSIFIIYGIVGLAITIAFAMGYSWAWSAMLIYNICALWNLFFGTASSVIQTVLLIAMRFLR